MNVLWVLCAAGFPVQECEEPAPWSLTHQVVARLGPERIRNTAWRRGAEGDRLVGWGRRILEWTPGADGAQKEVVPARDGRWFSNGGCVLDVNGDGVEELVVARAALNDAGAEFVWFEEVRGVGWTEHPIGTLEDCSGTAGSAPHDLRPIQFKDLSGETRKGIVAVISRKRLLWYEAPKDSRRPWVRHEIAVLPASGQSGLAVGDVAGRGRPDVVCGMFWVECPADPAREAWTVRRYGEHDRTGWGGMAKHALGDIDGDGTLDIVASEAEVPDSRLGVFCRKPEGLWEYRSIDKGLYCPHSVVLADLDGDGRLDVVAGEMTAGGWSFPRHPKPRLLAYLNRPQGGFQRKLLAEGWGIHEMGVRTEGRRVMLFGADEIQPQKFADMKTHVSLWTLERRR